MKTMLDLSKLALREPLTNAVLNRWKEGDYPSFEAALIDLACTLAEALVTATHKPLERVAGRHSSEGSQL